MKTGYSFGSLASFVEQINNTTVKLTGDQVIAGSKTFSSNPISSAAQGSGGAYLTRRDFVENLLSYKAPTDSPAFTGNPTAPTAALFDGDTTVATTQFVQRALGNHQSYLWTGDATLQPGWAGCFIWYAGAGTLYLPSYTSVSVGATFEIMCTGAGAITAQSGEQIILPNGAQLNSIITLVGDTGKFVRLDAGWAYSGSNYCATVATGDRSTRPASTQFVRNYLEASPQLAGNVHVEGTVNVTQEFQTTNAAGYRIAFGDYGAFWYFDNWNMYLMFTNNGDKWGSYNSLRPFYADCRTGRVGMSNGVSVGGGLTADSFTVSGNTNLDGHLNIKQYSFVNGIWWMANQAITVDGNYSNSAVYDVYFDAAPLTDCFLPIVGATTNTFNEGYQVRVKFGVYSTSGVGGWGRKHAGIWVGNGENTTGPKYLYKFNAYGGFYCNAVVADTTITAGTYIKAQNFVSTVVDAPGLRLAGGPYGVLFQNDGNESFYLLLTDANNQLGGFNNLRPFTLNRRTGMVFHNNGLNVSGGVSADAVNISGTLTTNGLICTSGTDFRAGLTVSGGGLHINNGDLDCNVAFSRSQQTFRQVYARYGMFWHADDSNHYLMLTNADDQYGSYNGLRPFYVSNSTGLVTCSNGISTTSLGVSGSIAVSGNATINGNVSAGDVVANNLISKSSYNQIDMGTTTYTKAGLTKKFGTSGDAKPFMIVVCPMYAGVTLAKTGLVGKITISRGTTGASLTDGYVDFSIVTAYNGYRTEIFHQNINARIVTTTYNGTRCYALYFDALSAVDVLFDGIQFDQDFTPTLIADATGYSVEVVGAGETYARLASPILTGTPTAPTAAAGTNNTTIATTAFVQSAINNKNPANKSVNEGYQQMPNGMIMKWGYFTSAVDENIPVTFSAATGGAFPNACVTVSDGGCFDAITAGTTWTANSLTRTGFVSNRDDGVQGTYTLRYIAWGY